MLKISTKKIVFGKKVILFCERKIETIFGYRPDMKAWKLKNTFMLFLHCQNLL
jgi:hypothetical protein